MLLAIFTVVFAPCLPLVLATPVRPAGVHVGLILATPSPACRCTCWSCWRRSAPPSSWSCFSGSWPFPAPALPRALGPPASRVVSVVPVAPCRCLCWSCWRCPAPPSSWSCSSEFWPFPAPALTRVPCPPASGVVPEVPRVFPSG